MTLFALGFVLTIRTLPTGTEMLGGPEGVANSGSSSMTLIIGFVASLVGLGMATIAPAVMFMQGRKVKG